MKIPSYSPLMSSFLHVPVFLLRFYLFTEVWVVFFNVPLKCMSHFSVMSERDRRYPPQNIMLHSIPWAVSSLWSLHGRTLNFMLTHMIWTLKATTCRCKTSLKRLRKTRYFNAATGFCKSLSGLAAVVSHTTLTSVALVINANESVIASQLTDLTSGFGGDHSHI